MNNHIMRQAYLVEGMTCAGCERTVSKVLSNLDGVESATANAASSTVIINYDPGKVNLDSMKAAVSKVGYKFVGERPAFGQREGSDEAV